MACYKNFCVWQQTVKNKRDYQEDRLRVFGVNDYLVAVICDGHGGHRAADFVIKQIFKRLTKHKPTWKNLDLGELLQVVSKEWDQECIKRLPGKSYPKSVEEREKMFQARRWHYDTYGWSAGTTCVMAAISAKHKRIQVANVGDSRAIWRSQKKGRLYQTRDHNPSQKDLGPLGGKVFRDEDKTKRIEGELAVGRALGDNTANLMGTVRADSDIKKRPFKTPFRMILASDGLWDTVSNQKAMEIFNPDKLVKRAIHCGSEDNISIISIEVSS